MNPVIIGDATLYLGDCMDIVPTLGKVDAVITDPPYGLGERTGTMSSKRQFKNDYQGFEDTPEYVEAVVIPSIRAALSKSACGIITPGGKCLWLYPPATQIGMIYQPAAVGMNTWGRSTCQPLLFYGRDPFVGLTIQPIHYQLTESPEINGHPCPKPIGLMKWLVGRASKDMQMILDPFMGSGTTGVAAIQLGRKFIGIEREPKYFDIACKRIEQAYKQGKLFEPEPMKQTQDALI